MQKGVILDQKMVHLTIDRLCQQLIENHEDFDSSVLMGLQPRGIFLAERIHQRLLEITGKNLPLGKLDITFFRDDFKRREKPLKANETNVPFLIENKKVILIDDVLFTGRSIRAAMDAMTAFGRPLRVELLVLIDRRYTRELPIQADYIGNQINSMISQKVIVDWKSIEGASEDAVWLINEEL